MAGRERSAFTSDGREPFPYTYDDEKKLSEVSSWPPALVRNKRREYEGFLRRADLMPRARKLGARILQHLEFEDEYNKGEDSFRIWLASKVMERDESNTPLQLDPNDDPPTEPFPVIRLEDEGEDTTI